MTEFHFIRPLWFLAIFVLIAAIFLLKRLRISQSGWQNLIPAHLAQVLISGKENGKPMSLVLPFIIGLLTITALAGPTWQKLPQPVYQIARGSVLVMDMSYSMYATDLAPNRLTRARYKAVDLLDNINEGEIGLVAYAGDAFTISPLTDDINNIKLLLPSLSPDIMPELGSNPFAALTLAHEMLTNAGHIEGDIYWFTDGIDNEDIQDLTDWSRSHPHRLNILGIGTNNGAPIKLPNGELMKDDSGKIIIPKLPASALKGVAQRGRGSYQSISNDFTDINALSNNPTQINDEQASQEQQSQSFGDQWQEAGPYLVLLLLPLVLFYFRRGTFIAILPFTLIGFSSIKPVEASVWQDLWKTQNQQAQDKYQQKEYQQAAEQFKDPLWQGSSHYKAGNYEQALKAFEQVDSVESLYNQGNALAKLQQLDQAIAAYDKVLEKNPEHADAKANKALLEQLKNQQQQNQQNQQQDNQEQNSQNDQQNQQSGQQNQSDEQQDSSQQQDNQNQQDQQSGSEQNSEQNNNNNQQQDNAEQQNSENNKQQDQQASEQEQEKSSAEQQEAEAQNNEQQAKTQAELAKERQDQETEQKHQQILNKVTDDPYLLLRNKMRLEYQKRRQDQTNLGVKKKW